MKGLFSLHGRGRPAAATWLAASRLQRGVPRRIKPFVSRPGRKGGGSAGPAGFRREARPKLTIADDATLSAVGCQPGTRWYPDTSRSSVSRIAWRAGGLTIWTWRAGSGWRFEGQLRDDMGHGSMMDEVNEGSTGLANRPTRCRGALPAGAPASPRELSRGSRVPRWQLRHGDRGR